MGKSYSILLLINVLLIIYDISANIVNVNSTENNNVKNNSEHYVHTKNIKSHRGRRSVDDDDEKPFWANRGKRLSLVRPADVENYENSRNFETIGLPEDINRRFETSTRNDGPFWGNRGIRIDSSSNERNFEDVDIPVWPSRGRRDLFNGLIHQINPNKDVCVDANSHNFRQNWFKNNERMTKARREDDFWGNRGRRSTEDEDESPFWGSRGRRDDGPIWGARGRRQDDTTGEVFWGTRGRRDEDSPFWGARGRRDEDSPFWGARGRKDDDSTFLEVQAIDEKNSPDSLFTALKYIKADLNAMPIKRPMLPKSTSFWHDRGRNSEIKYLFSNKERSKAKGHRLNEHNKLPDSLGLKSMKQDVLYADAPHYILVDRSSRSAGFDDDPYFISRGKKKKIEELEQAARDRRGIIEQIARTVQQDDPYFVARGKKDKTDIKVKYDEMLKARDLICSATDLMNAKNQNRNKREAVSDRDRNRRAILKKLAAQLQNDPYFVSRGKKNSNAEVNYEYLEEFVKHITNMCS